MVLYLCQHGDALAREIDPDRPLSERGTADVCNMANALRDNVRVRGILHSGKTRARQTAELIHERLAPDAVIEARTGLGPNDPAEDLVAWLASQQGGLMLAGHMPFVGRLASLLLGCGGRDILAFHPGTVAALSRDDSGNWRLMWMLTPELVCE